MEICFAVLIALGCVEPARAGVIESAPALVKSTDGSLLFDFSADSAELVSRPTLIGIDVLWKASPGAGMTSAHVMAGLAIPTFQLGDRLHAALDATLPVVGNGPILSESSFFDSQGLAIGPTVIEEFFHDGNDAVGAELVLSGHGATELAAFFEAGGTIEATLRLITDTPASVPGGSEGPSGNVPEPMSAAVWVAVGMPALMRARRRRTSEASNQLG